MDSIIINGGYKLNGKVKVQGSKNSVLPIMAASVLIKGITIIKNYPPITDVYNMSEILVDIGCTVLYEDDELLIDSKDVWKYEVDNEAAKRIRASIIMLGPLLSRFGKVKIPFPGGCDIGKRPIDIHLTGLKRLNASWSVYDDNVYVESSKLVGNDIHLAYPSVGATENIIIAAVMASGITEIHNAAVEPEIVELCEYLSAAGAKIRGIGTPQLIIEGVTELNDVAYCVKADRIVMGTYMCACIACGGDICFDDGNLSDTLGYMDILYGMGGKVYQSNEGIVIHSSGIVNELRYIETRPYPGFSTDMQQIVMSVLCKANGKSIICENIFENRLSVAYQLKRMGADIKIDGNKAYISGHGGLYGGVVAAEDLRGAAALIVAGLMAVGTTKINQCHYITRGYSDICGDLKKLGAKIEWEKPKRENEGQ